MREETASEANAVSRDGKLELESTQKPRCFAGGFTAEAVTLNICFTAEAVTLNI